MMKLEGEACFVNRTLHETLENAGAKLVAIEENGKEFKYVRYVSKAMSCEVDTIRIHLQGNPIRWSIESKNDVTREMGKRKEWYAYAAHDLASAHDLMFFLQYFAEMQAA